MIYLIVFVFTRLFVVVDVKCSIQTYSSPTCFDSRGKSVEIDSSFRSSMDTICGAASDCDVKLYITSSYRKPDATLVGTVATPVSSSNHKVGHAIDMNVVYGKDGIICDNACLGGKQPDKVKCFTDAVKKAGLRWGGDFNDRDPVHIDDGYNSNPTNYKDLYEKIQKECSSCNRDNYTISTAFVQSPTSSDDQEQACKACCADYIQTTNKGACCILQIQYDRPGNSCMPPAMRKICCCLRCPCPKG